MIKRGIYYIIVWFVGITIDFILPRLIPGSALASIIYSRIGGAGSNYGQNVQQEIQILVQQLGLAQYQQPLYIQYFNYLKEIVTLNFGVSLTEFPGVFSCSHLIRYHIVKLYQVFSNILYSLQVCLI